MTPGGAIPLRRTLGRALVASLSVAALTAIVALLSGSFDETDWRIIGTSAAFAVYSALAASGAALRLRELAAAEAVGRATVLAAGTAFALCLLLLWAAGTTARSSRPPERSTSTRATRAFASWRPPSCCCC